MTAAVGEIAPPQTQQLRDRRRPSFAAFQSDQGQIKGAAPQIHHQQPCSRRATGTHGGCGGFIDEGDVIDGQVLTGVQQPLPVAPVALHRCRQHKPSDVELLRKSSPDAVQQRFTGGFGVGTAGIGSDQTLEIALEPEILAVGQARLQHLPAHKRLL